MHVYQVHFVCTHSFTILVFKNIITVTQIVCNKGILDGKKKNVTVHVAEVLAISNNIICMHAHDSYLNANCFMYALQRYHTKLHGVSLSSYIFTDTRTQHETELYLADAQICTAHPYRMKRSRSGNHIKTSCLTEEERTTKEQLIKIKEIVFS